MKFARTSLAMALMATAAFSHAESLSLDNQVVTATRTGQSLGANLGAVTRLDQRAIQRLQPTDMLDLLRRTPSLSIVNNGGAGKSSTVGIRGSSSDHVLVLIDGVRIGSVTSGSAALHNLPIDQIERIEVVRGPRSSLYGSEAIGGVIQIFTRKGAEGFKPRFSVGAGSKDAREVTLGASGGDGQGWYNIDISDYSTDGFNAKTPDSYGYNSDNDGYDNRSYALSGGYRFSERVEAQFNWSQNRGDNEYDGGSNFDDYSNKARLQTLGTALNLQPAENWNLNLKLGQSRDKATEYGDGAYQSHIETQRDLASLQSEHVFARSQLTWGVDYQNDEVTSSQAYEVTERDNLGVFGLYQLFLGPHDVAFSLRRDDNEQFGIETTGSVAWGVELPRNFRLIASYGTAFKAPTFNELYWPDQGWYKGNADLMPEESESIEIGLAGDHAGIRWSANLYQNNIENLIDYDPSLSSPNNVNEARIRGLELTAATRLANWDLSTSLDLMDPKDRDTDELLNRRARKVFNLSADRDFGAYALGGSLHAVGKRNDGSNRLGGYTTVDLRGSYALGNDWSLKAKVENLLDEEYQTAYGYNQPDRTYWLSLHYAP